MHSASCIQYTASQRTYKLTKDRGREREREIKTLTPNAKRINFECGKICAYNYGNGELQKQLVRKIEVHFVQVLH